MIHDHILKSDLVKKILERRQEPFTSACNVSIYKGLAFYVIFILFFSVISILTFTMHYNLITGLVSYFQGDLTDGKAVIVKETNSSKFQPQLNSYLAEVSGGKNFSITINQNFYTYNKGDVIEVYYNPQDSDQAFAKNSAAFYDSVFLNIPTLISFAFYIFSYGFLLTVLKSKEILTCNSKMKCMLKLNCCLNMIISTRMLFFL